MIGLNRHWARNADFVRIIDQATDSMEVKSKEQRRPGPFRVRCAVALLLAAQLILVGSASAGAAAETVPIGFFPQVAIGDGYFTLFTVANTGSSSAVGSVTLKDQQGGPFMVHLTLTDSFGIVQPTITGYTINFTVPSGGTIFLSATALDSLTFTKVGWAELGSSGGELAASATYEYWGWSGLRTFVSVPQTQPVQSATVPVDNDANQGRQTAYAVANPGSQSILVKLALVSQNGTVIDDSVVLPLSAGQQISKYLYQDFGRRTFKGSLVIRGHNGATFVAVPLADKRGLLTPIPLIPAKAPVIPD